MSPTTPQWRPISDWRISTNTPAQSSSVQSIASPDGAKLYSLHFSVEPLLSHGAIRQKSPFFVSFFGEAKKEKEQKDFIIPVVRSLPKNKMAVRFFRMLAKRIPSCP